MTWSDSSKWIWIEKEAQKDSYGDFVSEFSYTGGTVTIKLSADSNYALYVNGVFVASEQYPDFPHYKVYDEIDITRFCKTGHNRIAITVWYYGGEFMTYYAGKAALRFEVDCNGELLCESCAETLSRKNPNFQSGRCHVMTPQLGYGFCYDATADDTFLSPSVIVEQELPLFRRSIHKTQIKEKAPSELVASHENYYLYDLGREDVGYLTFRVRSERRQKLTICFGEHIDDGAVRREIGGREFYVDVIIGEGETSFTNYFKRFGCRYLEVHSETALDIDFVSLLPCMYPLAKVQKTFKNPLHRKIYDVGVRTLELCLHDHYEDCPWREQGLYALDSRNQMLCGYFAFGEYAVPRDNLLLMSKVDREDNLLSICIPTSFDYAIPSFSLHYISAVYEYGIHSGDMTLAKEILPKLEAMIETFTSRIEDGLIANFVSDKWPGYWNFFEWREGLDGYSPESKTARHEAALNCLLSLTLKRLQAICDALKVPAAYGELANSLNKEIRKTFYNPETGLYRNLAHNEETSELVNAFAVLCGAASGEEAERICETLSRESDLTPISLSMACFKYDALLSVNTEKYAPSVIKTIETVYKKMLDAGATSFWEETDGSDAFAKAGSLCHGWSAMPVYYFHRLEEFLN